MKTLIKLSFVSVLGVTICILSGHAMAAVVESSVYHVAKTGHPVTTNDCRMARCQYMEVDVPLGSTIVEIQCWSNIDWPAARDLPHGQWKQAVCGGDAAWAYFDPASTESNSTNIIVKTTFHNRSSDWDRDIKLVVVYK